MPLEYQGRTVNPGDKIIFQRDDDEVAIMRPRPDELTAHDPAYAWKRNGWKLIGHLPEPPWPEL